MKLLIIMQISVLLICFGGSHVLAQSQIMTPTNSLLLLGDKLQEKQRLRIFPAMIEVAPVLADPGRADEWQVIQQNTHGIWVNGAGSTADEIAGMLRMLKKNTIPAILPGSCSLQQDGKLSCSSSSSLMRLKNANKRIAAEGKSLIATDRSFNLASILGIVPIEDIITAINASEIDPEYAGIRSGILLHPRDGLNEKLELSKQAIDAIDEGGVVAIEVSPSLLDQNIRISGCAEIWRYTKANKKQTVWLMNGPRDSVDEWIFNIKLALDKWQQGYGLEPDIIAPIATLVGDKMDILPEGDGSWPPPTPYTYMGMVHSLFGLGGGMVAP